MEPKDRIILAIDEPLTSIAHWMVEEFIGEVGGFKLGSIAISYGYAFELIEIIKKQQKIVFWDPKFHDTPDTMLESVRAVSLQGVDWISIHASAGLEGIRSAVSARIRSLIFGVTVLSSFNTGGCIDILGGLPEDKVLQFADLLLKGRAQGIITSPRELKLLSSYAKYSGIIKVAVGIRPLWAPPDDQQRHMTPAEAIRAGADYLVIGRPITHPPLEPREVCTPERALKAIIKEIAGA